ncbi:MAG: hypothetical protein ACTSUV_02115 [Candidatus Ranarchaeia archaeon]
MKINWKKCIKCGQIFDLSCDGYEKKYLCNECLGKIHCTDCEEWFDENNITEYYGDWLCNECLSERELQEDIKKINIKESNWYHSERR